MTLKNARSIKQHLVRGPFGRAMQSPIANFAYRVPDWKKKTTDGIYLPDNSSCNHLSNHFFPGNSFINFIERFTRTDWFKDVIDFMSCLFIPCLVSCVNSIDSPHRCRTQAHVCNQTRYYNSYTQHPENTRKEEPKKASWEEFQYKMKISVIMVLARTNGAARKSIQNPISATVSVIEYCFKWIFNV